MDETRIVGDLPNMRIEVTRRAAPEGGAELMTINLTATPDFRTAMPMLLQAPFALWQAMAAPWMALAQTNPFLRLPQPERDEDRK
ncbi:MAG TPA: hypothetical protein VLL76_02280 [Candidatus Omnitrophota bacterium]|nr:hypothetical protein [Candidatus Omnitrophota bacterium]